jgi:uncharacterized protein YjiS (DUF1127 family)
MAIIKSTQSDRSVLPFLPSRIPLPHVAGLGVIWAEWQIRRRYRKDLKRLLRVGPYMIEDVGLTLEEVKREIEKPLWQA